MKQGYEALMREMEELQDMEVVEKWMEEQCVSRQESEQRENVARVEVHACGGTKGARGEDEYLYVVEGVDKSEVARSGWMKIEQVMEQWGEIGR